MVVTESGGVVYVPARPVIPLGEEEQVVLSKEDQVISAVALYAICADGPEADTVVVTGGAFGSTAPPPHAARAKTATTKTRIRPGKNPELTAVLFVIYESEKIKQRQITLDGKLFNPAKLSTRVKILFIYSRTMTTAMAI